MASSVQAWIELWCTALAAVWAKTCPQSALLAFGTCLSKRALVVYIVSREGNPPVTGASGELLLVAALREGAQDGHDL